MKRVITNVTSSLEKVEKVPVESLDNKIKLFCSTGFFGRFAVEFCLDKVMTVSICSIALRSWGIGYWLLFSGTRE